MGRDELYSAGKRGGGIQADIGNHASVARSCYWICSVPRSIGVEGTPLSRQLFTRPRANRDAMCPPLCGPAQSGAPHGPPSTADVSVPALFTPMRRTLDKDRVPPEGRPNYRARCLTMLPPGLHFLDECTNRFQRGTTSDQVRRPVRSHGVAVGDAPLPPWMSLRSVCVNIARNPQQYLPLAFSATASIPTSPQEKDTRLQL